MRGMNEEDEKRKNETYETLLYQSECFACPALL
jgi:hypothetical protein